MIDIVLLMFPSLTILCLQQVFLDAGRPAPVIVAHSFGGVLLQKWVDQTVQGQL